MNPRNCLRLTKSYPYTVEGDGGDINAEIFVSPEKAGNGKDGIINEIAKILIGKSNH